MQFAVDVMSSSASAYSEEVTDMMCARIDALIVCCLQDANKDGETPLSLAGDLAAALQEASSSGKLYTNGFGAMEH